MSFAIDADPRFGRFGVRTECPRCGAHLPVNGPLELVDCAECGHTVSVPPAVIGDLLVRFEEAWPDSAEKQSVTEGDLTWRLTAEPLAELVCRVCACALDDREGDLSCGCGATLKRAPAPGWLVTAVQRPLHVLGAESEQRRDPSAEKPVVLPCPSCGATLSVTSRHQRVTPCSRCDSQVHLPDAVWRVLHPPRTVEPWVVRFGGESRPAFARRKEAEQEEKRREKERRKQEHQARQSEEARRREAEETAAKEEERRVQDEQRRRRERWTLVPTLLCGLLAIGDVVGMAGVTVVWAAAHTSLARLLVVPEAMTHFFTELGVVGMFFAVMGTWLVSVWVAAWRGGHSVIGMTFWSSLILGLSLIPGINLLFALAHFRDREPTPGNQKNPRFTGWPLALLYATAPPWFLIVMWSMEQLGTTNLRRVF